VQMTFSGSPLDPADRLRGDQEWLQNRLNDSRSRFLPMWQLMAFVDAPKPTSLVWLAAVDLGEVEGTAVFLGLKDDVAHFAIDVDRPEGGEAAPYQSFGHFMDVRTAGGILGVGESGILARARSLIDWHKRHRFCAQCGSPSQSARGGYMRQCPKDGCKAPHFPRVDPVVIMLIVKGDKCLLGRQARFPEGMYSALAGFMEPGETIEEAVRRESLEEAGIVVGDVRYLACQPWPFPSNLMIGCEAEALSEDITLDRNELELAMWVPKDVIRRALAGDETLGFHLPPPLAVAYHLVRDWAERD
jgi:NAD+ diphosphatase